MNGGVLLKRELEIGQYYRHFKNHWYKIICIAKHTEMDQYLAIYSPLYGNKGIFARPLDMFLEEVPKEKENPTGQKYRFMSLKELNLKKEDIHFD